MASIPKIAAAAVLCGSVFLAPIITMAVGNDESDAVNGVDVVHHSALDGIPHDPDAGKRMLASYYDRTLEGEPMANGRPFDADDYTAAHKSMPLGTDLKVRYGGESVRVTITDRGPYVAGRDLDLSLAAAQEIGMTGTGEAPVRVSIV